MLDRKMHRTARSLGAVSEADLLVVRANGADIDSGSRT